MLPEKHTFTNFYDFKFIDLDLELQEILCEDKKMVWRGEKKRRNEKKKGEMSETFVNHPLTSARHRIMTSINMCVAFINK